MKVTQFAEYIQYQLRHVTIQLINKHNAFLCTLSRVNCIVCRLVILKSVRRCQDSGSVPRRTATETWAVPQLVMKTSQEPPLMLEPVYLHWDGSYETDHVFFAHLRCKLDNINISGLEFGVRDLIVGSDEERALTKAVETTSWGKCPMTIAG